MPMKWYAYVLCIIPFVQVCVELSERISGKPNVSKQMGDQQQQGQPEEREEKTDNVLVLHI